MTQVSLIGPPEYPCLEMVPIVPPGHRYPAIVVLWTCPVLKLSRRLPLSRWIAWPDGSPGFLLTACSAASSELSKVAPGWHAIVVKASIFFLADTFVSGSVWEKEAAMVKSAGESLTTIYNLTQQCRTHPNIAAKAVCLPLEPCECFLHISTDIVH